MRGWTVTTAVIAVAFLIAAGYLTYRVTTTASIYLRLNSYQKLYYQEGHVPSPEEVDRAVVQMSRDYRQSHNLQLAAFLFDMYLRQAWNHPTRSVEPLGQAMKLGQELYQDPALREYTGVQLCWAYVDSGLPYQLEWWHDEVLARVSSQRPLILHMLFHARLLLDDAAGARQLIAGELADRGGQPETQRLAFSAYTELEDYAAAAKYVSAVDGLGELDVNTRVDYGEYLLHQGEYAKAVEQFRQVWHELGSQGDGALELAEALAAQSGDFSAEAQEMLALAAQQERNDTTETGARAWAASDLYITTNNLKWREKLTDLEPYAAQDFEVAAALATASLAEQRGEVTPPPGLPHLLDPVTLVQAAKSAATSDMDRQSYYLYLALTQAAGAASAIDPAAAAREAVANLRLACGLSTGPVLANSQNTLDYTAFLLDPGVQDLRRTNQAFDQAVHRTVYEYLEQRRTLFAGYLHLQELPQH